MAKTVTIETSSGDRVKGEVARRESHSPSGAQLLGLIACPLTGANWKGSETTVVTKNGDYVTGREVR